MTLYILGSILYIRDTTNLKGGMKMKEYKVVVHVEYMGVKDFHTDYIKGSSLENAHANALENWPDAYRVDVIG